MHDIHDIHDIDVLMACIHMSVPRNTPGNLPSEMTVCFSVRRHVRGEVQHEPRSPGETPTPATSSCGGARHKRADAKSLSTFAAAVHEPLETSGEMTRPFWMPTGAEWLSKRHARTSHSSKNSCMLIRCSFIFPRALSCFEGTPAYF
jgi:hypothetical protein